MDKVLSYTLLPEDLDRTAGGLVNLVLKNCVRVTGHEISAAKFLEDGITCGGRLIHVSERMQPGQTLRVRLPEEKDAGKLIASPGPIHILYEDEDLIAVDKAAGEVVHPCPGHYADTIANYLTWYLQRDAGPDASGLRIIGRLDKETSGVLVFARSRAAAARLQRQRQEGIFIRTYLGICEGAFPKEEPCGTIDLDMEKVPGVLMKMRTCTTGMRAVTHYRVLAEGDGKSLVRFQIETGRTHQIRVHMAGIGHPLCGDTLYGRSAQQEGFLRQQGIYKDEGGCQHVKSMPEGTGEGSKRALLHAVSVKCRQPFSGEKLSISSAIPDDFLQITRDWVKDGAKYCDTSSLY